MRILIVDDDADILKNLKKILLPTKYECEITTSPVDAIELIKNNSFDVIILDIKMAPIDGIAVLKEIYENKLSIYIIVISAFEIYSLLQIVFYNVYAFIQKPVDIKKLINTLREIEDKIKKG